MGLDIYLRQYKDYDDTKRREDEHEKLSQKIWKKVYKTDPESNGEYEALKKRISKAEMDKLDEQYWAEMEAEGKKLGLDKFGDDKDGSFEIEEPSKKHPKHDLFKVGYFRSSYNDSGIEHVVGEATGKGLYYIFDRDHDDEYETQPDWEACLKRAKEARDDFVKYLDEVGPYRVSEAHWNEFMGHPNDWPINSKEAAMDIFKKELSKFKNGDKSMAAYSNRDGEFYFDAPLQVTALITGVRKRFFVEESIPCTFIVYKSEGEDGLDFYLEALDIVIETIEYVIASPDRDKIWMAWSA